MHAQDDLNPHILGIFKDTFTLNRAHMVMAAILDDGSQKEKKKKEKKEKRQNEELITSCSQAQNAFSADLILVMVNKLRCHAHF